MVHGAALRRTFPDRDLFSIRRRTRGPPRPRAPEADPPGQLAAILDEAAHELGDLPFDKLADLDGALRKLADNCVGLESGPGAIRGVAIAFQIVTDARTSGHVNAGNDSTAGNDQCGNCQTLGAAHQFVVAKPTLLNWNDMSQLYQIDYKLQMLRWSHDPVNTVAGQVAYYADDVAGILAHAGSSGRHWPLVHHRITWHR